MAVVTDSTADLPPWLVRERGLTVVPLTVIMGGRGYLDGVEITAAEFYERIAAPGATATTSQPAPGAFQEVYDQLLADHDEVVSVHISSRLSYSAAVQGVELAGATPRVRVIDSGLVSMPLALHVLAAAALAEGGADARTIVDRLQDLRRRTRVYFMVGTLEYLRRGGRIGRASALLGSVLQVKPVLTIEDGQVAPLERVRTQDRALARVVELAARNEGQDGGQLCAIVGHAVSEGPAERIADALESRAESLLVLPLGPVVGAHAGPGTVGVGVYPAEMMPLALRRLTSASAS
ncbi:MAG: DegV family protein [Candidatus Dormibacteraeota bacterium]|nr:DegV family protein [Candidatus Dormibacteraeota bacterium]